MKSESWRVAVYQRGTEFFLKARHPAEPRYREKRLPGIVTKRDATRAAAEWTHKLNTGFVSRDRLRLSAAVELFETTHLAGLRLKSRERYLSAANWLLDDVGDGDLAKITTAALAASVARYRKATGRGGRLHTAQGTASYARHLKSFIRWAGRQGLMDPAVRVDVPRVSQPAVRPGCPGELLERVLELVPHKRPHDAAGWVRLLLLCRHAGLRVGEAQALRWGSGHPVGVERQGDGWVFEFTGDGQKSGRTETVPATPTMGALLDGWAVDGMRGRVCRVGAERADTASKIVADLFKAAGVPGGAHSLRREFAREWAPLLTAPDLKTLCRHGHISTTLKYYTGQQVAGLAARLAAFRGGQSLAKSLADGPG